MALFMLTAFGAVSLAYQNPSAAPVVAMRTSEIDSFGYSSVTKMKDESAATDMAIAEAMSDGKITDSEFSRILKVSGDTSRSKARKRLQESI